MGPGLVDSSVNGFRGRSNEERGRLADLLPMMDRVPPRGSVKHPSADLGPEFAGLQPRCAALTADLPTRTTYDFGR